ncbi:MAG: FecR domain-containing protein [Myxococcota bacterium]
MTQAPHNLREGRIADALDGSLEEARIQRIWRGTEAKLLAPRRGFPVTQAAGAAVGAMAIGVLAYLGVFGSAEPAFLPLADGAVPVAMTTEDVPIAVVFAEDSEIELAPESRLVPLRNDRGHFATELERGEATFRVTPGGARRWVVLAGAAQVAVVGTVFSVARDGEATRVEVRRGRVRVRATCGDSEITLTAGEETTVRCPEPEETAAAPEEPSEPLTAAEEESPSPREVVTPPAAWRDLAQRGGFDQAYESLGRAGVEAETERASPAELMLLADVARLSGHPREAIAPLERLLREHPSDGRAPIAAVVLGRIEMDALQRRDRAEAAFRRAEALGVPAALAADVTERLARLSAEAPTEPEPTTEAPSDEVNDDGHGPTPNLTPENSTAPLGESAEE